MTSWYRGGGIEHRFGGGGSISGTLQCRYTVIRKVLVKGIVKSMRMLVKLVKQSRDHSARGVRR